MHFDELLQFVERDMRMSHVYQPVMLRELLCRNGRATIEEIARALLNEDRSQIEYYSEITKNMVGRVLTNRHVAHRCYPLLVPLAVMPFAKITGDRNRVPCSAMLEFSWRSLRS